MVHEFEPRVGFCADSSELGAYFGFCVSFSLPLPHLFSVSVSQKHISVKKKWGVVVILSSKSTDPAKGQQRERRT